MSSPNRPGKGPEVNEEALKGRERRRDPRVTVPWPAIVEDSDGRLVTGMVAVKLTSKDSKGPMRIEAVVWKADARGAVLVFSNLAVHDFARLRSHIDSLLVHRG